MKRCDHVTPRGSRIHPALKRSWIIDWDWVEEGACPDADVEVDERDQSLFWSCKCGCGDEGRAELKPEA